MVIEADLNTADGRGLHFYDRGSGFPVFWLHGTPNTGPPPEPLFAAAERLGLRWLGYDRPGYGGSTPQPGRNVAGAAADLTAVADHLGLEKFAVMGHSGGGPHALAAAALLPGRVSAAVSISGLAPFDAPGLDWFAGMAAAGVAELRAAVQGRAALSQLLAAGEFDPEQFTAADWAALSGSWAWMGRIADLGQAGGIGPMVDDDLAYVAPWGFRSGGDHRAGVVRARRRRPGRAAGPRRVVGRSGRGRRVAHRARSRSRVGIDGGRIGAGMGGRSCRWMTPRSAPC